MTATLTVKHDGIRNHATVVVGGRAATLDRVIEAAAQADTETAAVYADVLRQVSSGAHLEIRKEIDGSPDAGCCWYGICLTDGCGGEPLTRVHRLTRTEFRGWSPAESQVRAERVAILDAAERIGLGAARHWLASGSRTVETAAR